MECQEFVIKIPNAIEEETLYKKLVDALDRTFSSTILDFKSTLKMDIEKIQFKKGRPIFCCNWIQRRRRKSNRRYSKQLLFDG